TRPTVRWTTIVRAALLCGTALAPWPAMAADYEIRGTTETVDGNGGGTLASPWTVGDRLRITNSGTLRVINGGQVTSSRAYLTDGATVTVTGHGSTWTTSGRTYVATDENNTAIMDIRDGATATTHGVTLGEGVGDKGTLTVTGHGTSWTSTGTRNAYVGYYGEGHLTVSDGASFKSPGLVVGYLPPQFGVIGGTGTVTLTDGGTISIDSGTGTLKLGSGPRTTGTLNIGAAAGDTPAAPGDLNAATVTLGSGSFNLIRGKGLVVFNHNSEDYTFSADIDGIGDVDVYSGVTTYTGTMGSNVTTTLRGGTFILNGSMESATLNGGGLYINGSLGSLTFQSGTLGGNTIPFGFTVPSGSVLAPG
ncbi:T5SS/PEP-CTERM-associated repeat-containing protein, partial [Rhodospira trueperi]